MVVDELEGNAVKVTVQLFAYGTQSHLVVFKCNTSIVKQHLCVDAIGNASTDIVQVAGQIGHKSVTPANIFVLVVRGTEYWYGQRIPVKFETFAVPAGPLFVFSRFVFACDCVLPHCRSRKHITIFKVPLFATIENIFQHVWK